MNYQNLIILGRATADAELITSNKKQKFTSFTIAVNKYLGKEKDSEVTYYDCTIFGKEDKTGKAAEVIKKGDLVVVQGRPTAEAYLSKTGEAKASLKVLVDSWQALK